MTTRADQRRSPQAAHVLEAAVDPVDRTIRLPREAQMLGLVVLADEVHYGVSVSDGIAHASLVGRAVIIAGNNNTHVI